MVAQFVAALERPISRVRLENYRTPGVTDDLAMVVNYFFNLELSEALYPSLQAFEVALRNSIHGALTTHYGTDLWFDTPGLFRQLPPPAPENRQLRTVREVRERLTFDQKPLDADRIVAELHFGFWHSMLNRPFEAKFWRLNSWRILREVFPAAPRRAFDRQVAWNRCDRIRIIRNRVMHYEPIWNRPRLVQDHADILEGLRWISEDMHETIAMCDRFSQVHTNGRASIAQRIQAEIQRRYPPPPSTLTT